MSQKRILVLVGKEDGGVAPVTYELLRAGRELADKVSASLCTAVLGHKVGGISQELAHYSVEVYHLDNPYLAVFQADIWVSALEKLCRDINPGIVLMGHTIDNQSLAPRLASRMGSQVIMDCIGLDIERETGHLLCTKEVYGGNAIAIFEMEKRPKMATLRPKVMEAIRPRPTQGKVIDFKLAIDAALAKTESIETVIEESVSLDKANAIVCVGRGLGSIERLKQLEELAELLRKRFDRVELGGSRPAIDAGWLSSSRQIGLTGEKVSPELDIAVGISGASQHLLGIVGSKKIVAINKDPQAAIFQYADYGVVDRYEDVLPAFIAKLRELL
jgi:electron transfer flavoprotein alpha subunit